MLGSTPLTHKNEFTLKIVRIQEGWIRFGVIDSNHKEERWTDSYNPNVICYFGCSGLVVGDRGQTQDGGKFIKNDDTITIRMDEEKGEIQWCVNEEVVQTYCSSRLKDSSIRWVPLLQMYKIGDKV